MRRRPASGDLIDGLDARVIWGSAITVLLVVASQLPGPAFLRGNSGGPLGLISAISLFLVMLGVLLGARVRGPGVRPDEDGIIPALWWSGAKRYLVYVALLLAIWGMTYLPAHVPGLDATPIAQRPHPDTGSTSMSFASTPGLADYPVPASAIGDLSLLRVGPAQLDTTALVVLLLVVVPVVLRLILSRRWRLVLLISVALWAVNLVPGWRPFGFVFGEDFPLLSWQILVVIGALLGGNWPAVIRWFDEPVGRLATLLAFLITVALVAWQLVVSIAGAREGLPDWAGFDPAWFATGDHWLVRHATLGPLVLVSTVTVLLTAVVLISGLRRLGLSTLDGLVRPIGRSPEITLLVAVPIVTLAWLLPNASAIGWVDSIILRLIVIVAVIGFIWGVPAISRRLDDRMTRPAQSASGSGELPSASS
ncbi:MAG TPA: OpgC domain-containing protein [Thermomicrobiales bacterium]|jgi:hypothetical protein|nr:OpgC domain-containing protein [Thermomicrobiales bacterium]